MVGAIAFISLQAFAETGFEEYFYPDYNSGKFITNVVNDKDGNQTNLRPEQPTVPQLDRDQVLVGIGVRSGATTVTRVMLHYRSIETYEDGQYKGLSEIRPKSFGEKKDHVLECSLLIPEDGAIVGLGFRIDGKDDFRFLEARYRSINQDGTLDGQIKYAYGVDYHDNRDCDDYGAKIEAIITPVGDKVITGVGLVNHDEDVDSLWIYRGDYSHIPVQ